MGYDYDGAIELLKSLENYDKDADIIAKIAKLEAQKSTMVPVDMTQVTHIFYHSLVVDPERGFAGNDSAAAGFKQWMTTVDEFNKITQAMYDNGYVLVDLHDLVTQTTDENGNVHFTPNQIMLPEGKKPFVPVSYTHLNLMLEESMLGRMFQRFQELGEEELLACLEKNELGISDSMPLETLEDGMRAIDVYKRQVRICARSFSGWK